MLFFHMHSSNKIYSQKLKVALHSKANSCNIGNFVRFYLKMWVEKTKHLPINSIDHSQKSAESEIWPG